MAFKVVCKNCAANLNLQSLPAKATPVRCPRCSDWVVVEPAPILLSKAPPKGVVPAANPVVKANRLPTAKPTPKSVPVAHPLPPVVHPFPPVVHPLPLPDAAEEAWVSTGPMPIRPLNRSAVVGGLLAASATIYIFQAIISPLPLSGSRIMYFTYTAISVIAAGIWGGHFAAAFAEDRKIRHSAQLVTLFFALIIGLLVGLGLARLLMTEQNFENLTAGVTGSLMAWEILGIFILYLILLGLFFVFGGFT